MLLLLLAIIQAFRSCIDTPEVTSIYTTLHLTPSSLPSSATLNRSRYPRTMDPRATNAEAQNETVLEALIKDSTNNYIADVKAKIKAVKTDDLVDL